MLPNAIANCNRNNPENRVIPVNLVRRFFSQQQKQKEERKQAEFEVFVRKSLKRVNLPKDSDYESENEIEIVREIKRPTKSSNQSQNKRINKCRFGRPIQLSNERPINRPIERSRKIPRVVNPNTSSSLRPLLPTGDDPRFITLRVKCFSCPKYFPTISHFDIHLQERHNILQHRCWLRDCGKSFENKTQFGRHLKMAHFTVTQWKCGFCNKIYKTHSDLYHHCRSIHLEGEFACSVCGYLEVNRSNAYNHYHKAHQGTV